MGKRRNPNPKRKEKDKLKAEDWGHRMMLVEKWGDKETLERY